MAPSVDPPRAAAAHADPLTQSFTPKKPRRLRHGERPTIVEFVERREYLGLALSCAQRVLLKAVYGLPLDDEEEREMFARCTGRAAYVAQNYGEVTVVAGRRSGKDSRIAVPIALYEAIFGGHRVATGEIGVVPLFAQDAEATQTAFTYAREYLQQGRLEPYFNEDRAKRLMIRSADGQPMEVKCLPCTGRPIRGASIPAAVLDEVGFYRTDGGKPLDKQVQEAVRAGMVSFAAAGHPRLVKISTPALAGRTGVMFEDYDRYWGQEQGDVLVWHAPSLVMNPTLSAAFLERERRKNPLSARREFDAEFIAASESAFLDEDRIRAAGAGPRPFVLPPDSRWRYVGFVDPSGGGRDEFALAIGHTEDGRAVRIDYLEGRRRPIGQRLALTQVVAEYAAVLKRYRCATVKGDKFAGDWVAQEFRKHGVAYDAVDKTKSQLYREAKPFFNEDRIEVPADGDLLGQLGGLEERVRPGGRVPTVDHPPGGHDDRANAVCGVIAELAASMQPAVGGTADSFARMRAATGPAAEDPRIRELEAAMNVLSVDGVPRRGSLGLGHMSGLRMFR